MGATAECVMTKGHIDNPLPNKTLILDLEVLPLPMNISKTKVSNYQSQSESFCQNWSYNPP